MVGKVLRRVLVAETKSAEVGRIRRPDRHDLDTGCFERRYASRAASSAAPGVSPWTQMRVDVQAHERSVDGLEPSRSRTIPTARCTTTSGSSYHGARVAVCGTSVPSG